VIDVHDCALVILRQAETRRAPKTVTDTTMDDDDVGFAQASRTFSIAMTAWSAKVCSNWTWCGANVPGSFRVTTIRPIGAPLLINGESNVLRNPRARAKSLKPTSGLDSVSASWTTSPLFAKSKNGSPATGRGKEVFRISSAAGLIGVYDAR
jgi:hypothetical protein